MTPDVIALAETEERELLREGSVAGPSSGLAWVHPGLGEECDSTGEPIGWKGHRARANKYHAVPIIDRCDSYDCPKCWRHGWMTREAEHLVDVLLAERKERIDRGQSRGVIHFSIDPPPALYASSDYLDPAAYSALRTEAARVAREAGMEMFSLTPHHERCADRADPVATDGIHFHGLGFGWVDGGQFSRTGWVVKNHGRRLSRRSQVATAEYILSHASRLEGGTAGILPKGKSASPILVVTWYGRTPHLDIRPEKGWWCPLCRARVAPEDTLCLYWEGQGPPPTEPVETDACLWRASVLDWTDRLHPVEVPVPMEEDDEDDEEPFVPAWGTHPACVFCLSRWKPGDGELRCPHL